MSGGRRDPHKVKLRRDRIRRQQHNERAGSPPTPDFASLTPAHPFAAERSMREIQALLEGQKFGSVDEINTRLAELTATGRIPEMAEAWKREDPKWKAQELAYEALETESIVEALRLVNEALRLDPDCTDAQRLMVSLAPMELDNRIRLMREVVDSAERNLGGAFIEENTGRFWGIMATRPFMRAKQHLAELLVQAGLLSEAIPVFERLLELNSNDNQGMRYQLLGLYLAAGRKEGADRLFDLFPEEEGMMGSFAWARVLERWLSGSLDEAMAALERARRVNPFVERYISGARKAPRQTPEYFEPGKESEAQVCARELALASERHPEFRKWLRAAAHS